MNPRLLSIDDYHKGYLNLLNYLTDTQAMSESQFQEIFEKIQHQIWVIEDQGKIIASATLLIEDKFIHGGSRVGHIEDVVVDPEYRGHQLGRLILDHLKTQAQQHGCYKLILDCHPNVSGFYIKLGFHESGVHLRRNLRRASLPLDP